MYKQAIIVLGLQVLFSSVAQAGLVGIGSSQLLYDIDPVTGVASNPRETDEQLLTVGFANGTLYGLGIDRFFTVNIATGELHLLGILEGFAFNEFLRDLAWDSQTDTFFGNTVVGGTQGSGLVSFNLDTLALTRIGPAQFATALAFDQTGTLFAVEGIGQRQLYTIDKTTSQILSSVTLSPGVNEPLGLAFGGDGTLFMTGTIGGESVLHRLDPLTGVQDALGGTGLAGGILSLTYVPEPGTLLLLGSGAFVILRRRKRTHPARSQGHRRAAYPPA